MRKIINTDKAPAAIGPYSQAVQYGDLLFTSGQIAIIPDTGQLTTDDIKIQTKQVLENLTAVIKAAQMDLSHVIKCSCFLKNMDHFIDFNEVYNDYFGIILPARECVEVTRLPKDVLVEVSAVCGR